MSESFDPYHRWLGIPPKHQPPDYYRLLALERFEDDEEVIRDAAEQRIGHVRNYRLGDHAELAHKLLNELGRAKAWLLDDRKREEYDQGLRAAQGNILDPPAVTATTEVAHPRRNEPSAATALPPPLRTPGNRSDDNPRADEPPIERSSGIFVETPPVVTPASSLKLRRGFVPVLTNAVALVARIPLEVDLWLSRLAGPDNTSWHKLFRGFSISLVISMVLALVVAITQSIKDDGDAPVAALSTGTANTSDADAERPKELLWNSIGMKLKLIPAGEFLMGSGSLSAEKDEQPPHRVRISRDFYLGTTEVTQGQWRKVMGTTPWSGKTYVNEGASYPATYVSWGDAVEFCRRLSAKEGIDYRLPSEAEWEYACRAGSTTVYSFGGDESQLGQHAWFVENAWNAGERYAHLVGLKQPNAWGLYDMHGNVWEWCQDWYGNDYYQGSESKDPVNDNEGTSRVLRGGSWVDVARDTRSALRYRSLPSDRSGSFGFRLARTP